MKWVTFLRGINVGGHRKLPMAALRAICADRLAARNIKTYIASGNVIFEADGTSQSIAATIQDEISDRFDFELPVLVLSEADMRAVHTHCPYPRDASKLVHGYLCFGKPDLDYVKVETLRTATERVACVDHTVWLYAPDGIGQSKLAAKLERLLGTAATARNLNTINKMVEMLDG